MSVEPVELEQDELDVREAVAEQRQRVEETAAALVAAGYSVQVLDDPCDRARAGELAAYVSPRWCEHITVTTRCRLVDGAWQYEVSAGPLVVGSVSALVTVLGSVLSFARRG